MYINDSRVDVSWADNATVSKLRGLAGEKLIEIQMRRYGGFEQVGEIGKDLPRADVQMTTAPGDIVLYSGNQIVVFSGTNTWAYTRLGHIEGKTAEELEQILGKNDIKLTIKVE